MAFDIFDRVDEIVSVLDPRSWMLVGGLMVHAQALLASIEHPRPTDDADLVVELRAGSYGEAAAAVQQLGYVRHESLDHRAPFHRFTRAQEHIDLMAPEDKDARFAGRPVLTVPGSRSALRRTVPFVTAGGTEIRIPDLASALSLKGAAYALPGANRVRHLQDAVTLFACGDDAALELSRSMRANVNHLVAALDAVEPWGSAPQAVRRRAVRAILLVRPDWSVPAFVLVQRPRRDKS